MDTESPGPEGPPNEEDPVTTPPRQEDITALVQELEQSFAFGRPCEAERCGDRGESRWWSFIPCACFPLPVPVCEPCRDYYRKFETFGVDIRVAHNPCDTVFLISEITFEAIA